MYRHFPTYDSLSFLSFGVTPRTHMAKGRSSSRRAARGASASGKGVIGLMEKERVAAAAWLSLRRWAGGRVEKAAVADLARRALLKQIDKQSARFVAYFRQKSDGVDRCARFGWTGAGAGGCIHLVFGRRRGGRRGKTPVTMPERRAQRRLAGAIGDGEDTFGRWPVERVLEVRRVYSSARAYTKLTLWKRGCDGVVLTMTRGCRVARRLEAHQRGW